MNLVWTPYSLLGELEKYFEGISQKASRGGRWLEMDSSPRVAVPWNMPMSTVIDMFTDENTRIPYAMTLHLRNPPDKFVPIETMETLKNKLKNSLKAVSVNCNPRLDCVFIQEVTLSKAP